MHHHPPPPPLDHCLLQISEYKGEIERVTREMLDAKKAFYESRKKEQQLRSLTGGGALTDPTDGAVDAATSAFAARAAETQRTAAQASVSRFVGGGFSVHHA
jgi:hypothetical protein